MINFTDVVYEFRKKEKKKYKNNSICSIWFPPKLNCEYATIWKRLRGYTKTIKQSNILNYY